MEFINLLILIIVRNIYNCLKKIEILILFIFFIIYNMLLNDLLKLFSTNFNINEERFISIIESNNIKLSQRLLVEINSEKKNNSSKKNSDHPINDIPDTNFINSDPTSINIINSNSENDVETKVKKETSSSGRGRGRPRKTKELKEESSVIIEVELIIIEEKEYYKTSENVLLNKDMEIEGIYRDGKIVKR